MEKNNNGKAFKVVEDKSRQHKSVMSYFCKKAGHMKREYKKYIPWKKKSERANKITEDSDICISVGKNTQPTDSWYVDFTTSHMTKNKYFFNKDFKEIYNGWWEDLQSARDRNKYNVWAETIIDNGF